MALTGRLLDGLRDTFELLRDEGNDKYRAQIVDIDRKLSKYEKQAKLTIKQRFDLLHSLVDTLTTLVPITARDEKTLSSFWSNALLSQCNQQLDELANLAPWVLLPGWQNKPNLISELNRNMSLQQVCELSEHLVTTFEEMKKKAGKEDQELLEELEVRVGNASKEAGKRLESFADLVRQIDDFSQMDFTFLYDHSTNLLSIGYNITDRKIDNSYYDLLASEARLTSFVAIAMGQIPQENWFALGRMMTVHRRRSDSPVVERLDVRIPDAASGHAEF